MLKVSERKRVSCEIIAQVFYFLVFPHDKDNPRSAHVRTGGYLCRWDYNPVGVGEDHALSTDCGCCPLGPRSLGSTPAHPRTPEEPRRWGEQAATGRAAHGVVVSTRAPVPLALECLGTEAWRRRNTRILLAALTSALRLPGMSSSAPLRRFLPSRCQMVS